jgi:hypothetical protein
MKVHLFIKETNMNIRLILFALLLSLFNNNLPLSLPSKQLLKVLVPVNLVACGLGYLLINASKDKSEKAKIFKEFPEQNFEAMQQFCANYKGAITIDVSGKQGNMQYTSLPSSLPLALINLKSDREKLKDLANHISILMKDEADSARSLGHALPIFTFLCSVCYTYRNAIEKGINKSVNFYYNL